MPHAIMGSMSQTMQVAYKGDGDELGPAKTIHESALLRHESTGFVRLDENGEPMERSEPVEYVEPGDAPEVEVDEGQGPDITEPGADPDENSESAAAGSGRSKRKRPGNSGRTEQKD